MITRLPAAVAVCVCVSGCVSSYTAPRQPPPSHTRPPSASATPGGGASGQTQAHGPKESRDPKWSDGKTEPTKPKREVEHLEVEIQSKNKSRLLGKVKLTDVPGGVKVVVRVDNVKPGLHGVHITEFADCSAKDATSAGHHFNPDDNPHALPTEKKRHLGDLGNIVVKGPDGSGRLEIVVPRANLTVGAPRSLLNRALVVHADPDNGTQQPGGNSGERIGCAELTIAAAKTPPSGKLVMAE